MIALRKIAGKVADFSYHYPAMNLKSTASMKKRDPLQAPSISSTVGYFAAFIALGLVGASLGPTLPGLAKHTGSQLSQISFLFTARALGYLLGSVLGGQLYDRFPGHPVLAIVLFLMAGFMATVPIITWLALLALVLLLTGMVEGALDVGGNTLLVWLHDKEVGPYMNALHFFFGVGSFLSPIIIAQAVLVSGDIYWAYWLLALLMLPPAVWLLRLKSPQSQAIRHADRPVQTNYRLVALCALFLFLYVGAEVSFGGWIFTYAVRLNIAGETTAAYLTSAFWGSLTLGRLLSIPVTARLRPRTILLVDVLGCLASIAVIMIWPGSLAAIWIGTLGLGFFMATIFPITLSLAGRRMTITGTVTSMFFVGASAGSMTLPWLIGQFFNTFGPQVTMVAIAIDLALALVIYVALISHAGQPQGSTGKIGLRAATKADYQFLYQLHISSMKSSIESTWGWDEAWQMAYFQQHFDPARRQIVQVDGQDVGAISIERRPEEYYLALIELLPEHQGQGLGTRLMDAFIRLALNAGQPAALHVLKANATAHRFYERLGFLVVAEETFKYRMQYDAQRYPPKFATQEIDFSESQLYESS